MTTSGNSSGASNSGGSSSSAAGQPGQAQAANTGDANSKASAESGEGAAESTESLNDTKEKAAPVKKQSDDSEESSEESSEDDAPESEKPADKVAKKAAKSESQDGDHKALKAEVTQLRETIVRNREANKRIAAVLQDHPEVAGMLRDLDRGMNLRTAIARNMDTDGLQAMVGDPDYNEIAKAKQERADKRSKDAEYEQTLLKNREFTQREYTEFAKEHDMSDDEAKSFVETLQDIVNNVNSLKIDRKIMGIIRAAMTKDRDMESARQQGEVKGKNEAIVARRSKKESQDGDGLPALGDGGASVADLADVMDNPLVKSINKFTKRQYFN